MTDQDIEFKIITLAFETLKIIAWPACISFIIFCFRKQLKLLIPNLKIIKIPVLGTGVEFRLPTKEITEDRIEEKNNEGIAEKLESDKKTQNEEHHWFFEFINYVDKDEIQKAKNIFEEYKRTEKDKSKISNNTSFCLYYLYTEAGDKESLVSLKEHFERSINDDEKLDSLIYYTKCLELTKQYSISISLLNDFIKNVNSEKHKAEAIDRMIDILIIIDKLVKAKDIVMNSISEFKENHSLYIMYKALSRIEDSLGNDELAILCLDKSLDYNPTDEDVLFQSAFKASANSLSFISISNYSTLLGLNRKNPPVLNNIGVCAEKINLKSIANDYYNEASKQSYSLSLVNRGYAMLNAGLLDKAQETANMALQMPEPHPNVHSLIKAIMDKKENESKEWDKVKLISEKEQRKIRKYIDAYVTPPKNKIQNSKWKLPSGEIVSVEVQEKNKLQIKWEEEINNSSSKYYAYLDFSISNSSVNGLFFKYIHPKQERNSLLGVNDNYIHSDFYGYLSEDENTLIIFDKNYKKDFQLNLIRILE
ncbi:hypothetical protein V9P72_002766 [Yersinia enterocolitica]|uniref:tetratricopeptide repeat protein n=1 Tax=Yersinia enterocolitica TaxID=630 RepID=UPI002AC51DAC|nr:hypothetical protein [Yersinia enterocolitica]HEN3373994.1 hypothetical protein [Yersinia enterocolitica]